MSEAELLTQVGEALCSAACPSVWPTGEKQPHSAICGQLQGYITSRYKTPPQGAGPTEAHGVKWSDLRNVIEDGIGDCINAETQEAEERALDHAADAIFALLRARSPHQEAAERCCALEPGHEGVHCGAPQGEPPK